MELMETVHDCCDVPSCLNDCLVSCFEQRFCIAKPYPQESKEYDYDPFTPSRS